MVERAAFCGCARPRRPAIDHGSHDGITSPSLPLHSAAPLRAAGLRCRAPARSTAQRRRTAARRRHRCAAAPRRPTSPAWATCPLARTPLQASVFGAEQLQDRGAQRLSDLTRLRRRRQRRLQRRGLLGLPDGARLRARQPLQLPPRRPADQRRDLDRRWTTRRSVEVLKGTSGMQAGTSAPGGLVNFVVKRPTERPLRRARSSGASAAACRRRST